jgi:predicted lipoprotein
MSIAAITGGTSQLCALQSQYQQVHSQFKQLGQDLQAGNLTKAQSDFVTLSQAATSQLGSSGPMAQALSKVGSALQSGDLSAAQQAFTALAKVGASAVSHHSHVPPMTGKLTQGLDQLGQALQSGDLSAAQQAFTSLQQAWRQVSGADLSPSTSATQTASTTSISV